MRKAFGIGMAVIGSLCLASCGYILPVVGSGNIVTNDYELDGFTAIEASNAMDVAIVVGPEYSVSVKCDDNIIEHLQVTVSGGALHLGDMDIWSVMPKKLAATVTMPSLVGISASGAAKVDVSDPDGMAKITDIDASGASEIFIGNLSVNTFAAQASGASQITIDSLSAKTVEIVLSGGSEFTIARDSSGGLSLVIDASGASKAKLLTYPAETAIVNLSGASEAEVTINQSLHGTASGASSVKYAGPGYAVVSCSGASTCKRVD